MSATPEASPIDWLTADDVARILGVSKRTVMRLAASGDLGFVQVAPGMRRWLPEHIDAYVKASTVPPRRVIRR